MQRFDCIQYDFHLQSKTSNSDTKLHVSRYLQEFQPLGTVGGLYHFRDQIMLGNPSALIVLYADISSDFPLKEMWEFHKQHNHGKHTVLGTEVISLIWPFHFNSCYYIIHIMELVV